MTVVARGAEILIVVLALMISVDLVLVIMLMTENTFEYGIR